MIELARLLGDRLWGAALWLSRRRWARRVQRFWIRLAPEALRARVRRAFRLQNRFARRVGRIVLLIAVLLLLWSLVLTLLLLLALDLIDRGVIPWRGYRDD